ncbi:MAG TPA: isocitrate lyase/phosphoenolpyruvate mutase family protein [Ktedonobacteraceae bacterium]|nr:isocitrate lyase/phosphoenolpyruvate mutase family protein [Ktedonobacteraceae bacterium]
MASKSQPVDQKTKAMRLRELHHGPAILVLPNAWDVASARIFEQAGFPAIATTSSGVAAALGYPDGQHIKRDEMIEAVRRIAGAVSCPVTADMESGFGDGSEDVMQTMQAVIEAGAVGVNIEDSTKKGKRKLLDADYQVALLKEMRQLGDALDVPLVINARTDVYLLPGGNAESKVEQAVQRANAYLAAGADCFFPIGASDAQTIAALTRAISGPVNVLAGSKTPSIAELARLGVARVSFGSGPMRAALGYLRAVAQELHDEGTYTRLLQGAISGNELRQLVE